MVFVNSKKFACESCIKGHRSSSCHHSERPLFEIKKKGRPVSQCEKCRQLRQSRKVHSKCTCNDSGEGTSSQAPATGSSKGKRFIPITPALPNGIKDILEAASNISKPADTRQLVDSLLNPCKCKNSRRCKCLLGMKDDNITPSNDDNCSGLTALAQAAELFERGSPSSSAASATPEPPRRKTLPPKPRLIARPNSPNRKRRKHTHPPPEPPRVELPPIHISEFQGVDEVPIFGTMPSISEITSIAGSGCTCGLQCSCPGCVDHRGPEHASAEHGNCTDGSCRSCVDNQMGVELPTASTGLLRDFYTLAARLPEPPKIGASRATEPVNLPKLDCCGGQCGCPGGRCGCGKACDGCCEKHTMEKPLVLEEEKIPEPVVEETEKRSCCCG